jgi:hypothetical protein
MSEFLFNKRGTCESVNAATISKRYRYNFPISTIQKILIEESGGGRKSFFYHYHPRIHHEGLVFARVRQFRDKKVLYISTTQPP